jgi:hypothetical protein
VGLVEEMDNLRERLKSWDTLVLLALAASPWLLFLPATLGQGVFAGGDVSSIAYPTLLEYARALAEGRLPLWTPGMQAGFPLFAEGQIAALYPPNLLLYRLLPIHLALSYSILLHLSWACVGMYLLCRSAGLRIAGAALAGIAFTFGGFFLAHVQHLALLATAAWLPWLIYLPNRYRNLRLKSRQPGRELNLRRLLFIAVSIALAMQLLSGSPQIALINLVVFALVSTFDLMQPDPSAFNAHRAARNLGRTVIWVALGLALAAIQLLPMAELTVWSDRMYEGENFFLSYSLDPIHLSQFISPFWSLGEPIPLNQEFWGYVGVIPLLLAVSAPLLRRDARAWVVLCLALLALALALGEANPVYRWLYYVPLVNRFRVPARFLFFFTFFTAYLAAVGLDELQRRGDPAWSPKQSNPAWLPSQSSPRRLPHTIPAKWSDGVIALVVVGIVALKAAGAFDAWTFLAILLLVAGAAFIALAIKRIARANALALWVIGASAFELTLYAMPFLFTLDALVPPAQLTNVPDVFRAMQAGASERVYTNVSDLSLRPNRPMAFGKPGAQANSPLALRKNNEYLRALTPAMLNLMNVRYVLEPLAGLPESSPAPRATRPLEIVGRTLTLEPTRAAQFEIVSYTENTLGLADGVAIGELTLIVANDAPIVLPIRLGIETADWLWDVAGVQARHKKIADAIPIVGYSSAGDFRFSGSKYVHRYSIANANPPLITSIGARVSAPNIGLTIERVALIDQAGKTLALSALTQQSDLSLVYRDERVGLYENRNVLPRAFIVHAAEVVADEQVLARMQDPAFQPNRLALLSDGAPLSDESPAQGDAVEITLDKPERVVVKAQSARAGFLVLADTWYPGWTATVDGRATPIARADYVFRAVLLAPGAHTIAFEYRPPSVAVGAAISGLALIVLIVLGAGFKK